MASHLDLEEQEQLDRLKAFWNRWGNLVTAVLVIAAGVYAASIGWNVWQRNQAAKAASMYDELGRAAQSGDVALTDRIFGDLKERYPRTAFASQAGLVAAKVAALKGQADAARANLAWVADNASDDAHRDIARLRLAGILLDEKKLDEALRTLDAVATREFAALAADRRGDILFEQGKGDEARAAWRKALQGLDAKVDYRRVVEAKVDALGAAVAVIASAPAVNASGVPSPVASASAASSVATRASGAEPR